MYAFFLHPALAQKREDVIIRSNYTCTYFPSYDTPVYTWKKRSLDVKHEGMGMGTWGYEIISNKNYLVGKCVMNGRQ